MHARCLCDYGLCRVDERASPASAQWYAKIRFQGSVTYPEPGLMSQQSARGGFSMHQQKQGEVITRSVKHI